MNIEEIKFEEMNKTQILGEISNIARTASVEKDSSELVEMLNRDAKIILKTSPETFIKLLKLLKRVLLKEDDHVSYINGIKTLLDCDKLIGGTNTFRPLKKAFQIKVLEVERNVDGFKMWMQDALNAGIFTKTEYKTSITKAHIEVVKKAVLAKRAKVSNKADMSL